MNLSEDADNNNDELVFLESLGSDGSMNSEAKKESNRKEGRRTAKKVRDRKSANKSKEFTTVPGDIKDPLAEKLLEAVNNENEQEVEQILKADAGNIDRLRNTEIRGGTLLHYACSRNNAAVIEVLIRNNFDINKKTSAEIDLYIESFDYVSKFRAESTPLYIATVAGLTDVATLLVQHGADPNIQDAEGYTPLHSAAWHNKVDLIRQLFAVGAKINIQDSTGSTPLRKAAYRGHIDSVKQLLNYGANPNIKTKKGRASIHCAALYGHTDVLAMLIDHGAMVNIQDNDEVTPLHAAVYNGKRLAVRLLLKSKAEVDIKTKFGNTPLHLACMERWFVIASLLVHAGANYEIENRFGETPASIMETGNAGKRVNIFNKQNAPTISELEQLEAEHKERCSIVTIPLRHLETNGQKPTRFSSCDAEINPDEPHIKEKKKLQ